MRITHNLLAITACALVCPSLGQAADSNLTTGVTVEYTSGKYGGAESTDILYIPVFAKYRAQSFTFGLTIPYIRISGPGNVVGGLTPIVQDRRNGASKPEDFNDSSSNSSGSGGVSRVSNSGLGDIIASVTYAAIDGGANGMNVDIGTRVKFGTADETKNLGTGKNDYSLEVVMDKPFGNITPSVTVGRRWMGDTDTIDFRNVWYASAGLAYRLARNDTVTLDYDYGQAVLADTPRSSDLTIGLNHKFGTTSKVRFYALKGLNDGSPDYGGGISLYAYF